MLLASASRRFPDGRANSSGWVGTHLMFNGGAFAGALFDHEINGHKGVVESRVIHDFYELDPKLGIDGGGGIDLRFEFPPVAFAMFGLPMDALSWGMDCKRLLRDSFTRSIYALCHTTSLPVASNSISLDPTVKDAWGLPAIRMTFS